MRPNYLAALLLTLFTLPAFGQTRLTVDQPSLTIVAFSGTAQFYGWSVDDQTSISSVELNIDGGQTLAATYGVPRADVCAALPGRSGCPNVGWTYALDTTTLANGSHMLQVTTTSATGNHTIVFQQFIVVNGAAPLIKVLDKWAFGGSVSFTLSATPAQAPDVFLNGLLQDNPGDYTLAGTVITFNATLSPGDGVKAIYFTNRN